MYEELMIPHPRADQAQPSLPHRPCPVRLSHGPEPCLHQKTSTRTWWDDPSARPWSCGERVTMLANSLKKDLDDIKKQAEKAELLDHVG